MTSYQNLHWDSINFVKAHLYRRVASPLNDALARLALAAQANELDAAKDQLKRVRYSLELALNLIKAWASLIYVQNGGVIPDYQRRQIAPDGLPEWVVEYLNTQTVFRVEHTQPVFVHPETFYESLILLCQVGRAAGDLKYIVLSDARGARSGVWIRGVFEPPHSGPYSSLNGWIASLDPDSPSDQEVAIQLQVLGGFLKINRVRFMLQNNVQTGEQALTALLPAATAASAPLARLRAEGALAGALAPKTVPLPSSESVDSLASRETGADQQAEHDAARDESALHLTGPVLAPTPREIVLPVAEPMQADGKPHTLAGPVLAPTPRAVAPSPDQPSAPSDPEDPPDMAITPPSDFRRRLITRPELDTPDSELDGTDAPIPPA
ncbi:MAG: hypothetical protein JW910_16585 [Anaerolineae bacterium]|nr:hypothetical protein [Anaerolineae bacterium]